MKLHEWKTRIQSGEHLLGTMVTTFASADLPKILKACGFDFFIIDCEHGSFTTREVADMICVARAIELPGMVRIPELRREHVLHCMERVCCCRTRKRPNRRVSLSTLPSTPPWGTAASPSPGRIRIF